MIPSIEQLAPFLPFFLITAVFGLTGSLYTEQTQIIAKIRGAQRDKIASGYNSAMKIMIFNRFGTIIYMFFVALSIDIGISNANVIYVAMSAVSLVFCYNVYLWVAAPRILLYETQDDTEQPSWLGVLSRLPKRYVIASYAATLLNVMGLTLPLLLSNSIPEYRLSMANTGFLLNTFFTLINVLLLEAKIAEVLDQKNRRGAYEFALTIFVTRAFATLTAVGIYLWLLSVV